MHPHSFYVAYHIPTSSLRVCSAETVHREYEHAGKNWTRQRSLTVSFTDELTNARLERLAAVAISAARAERDRRSEEHTSELQSLMRISYAVFCLKKKKTKTKI